MAASQLDPDIEAATPTELSKKRLQEYRNEVQQKYQVAKQLADDTLAKYADLDAHEVAQFKRELILICADKFMTPGTEVDPALVDSDALRDAVRAKAHFDAFCKAFGL